MSRFAGLEMLNSTLRITNADLQAIVEHCNAGYPNEACGILAGRDNGVEKVYLMKNSKPGPDYYEMDPEEQFRIMKDIRDRGLAMVGMFHSHPSGQAFPSSMDVEKAYWPGTEIPNYPDAIYMIVSLMDRSTPVARGFSIQEGKVQEITVSVV
jgi:proteasome lid subunit RPN8/RPN11